jgi:hypothetical protein
MAGDVTFPFNLYKLPTITINPMVEIFKTNVTNKKLAGKVLKTLRARLPAYHFNFDLEDCDRILRAQSEIVSIDAVDIVEIVKNQRVEICLFED